MRTSLAVLLAALTSCACQPPVSWPMGEAPLELTQACIVQLAPEARPIAQVDLGTGKLHRFLLDTGSDVSLIDERCVAESGLVRRPYATSFQAAGSGGGEVELHDFVRVERLVVGALVVAAPRLTVIGGGGLVDAQIDGILGQDLLARLALVVDAQRHELHVLPTGGVESIRSYIAEAKIGDGAWAMAQIEFRPIPSLPLDVAGTGEPLRLDLDTGALATALPKAAFTALGLTPIGRRTRGGVDGHYEVDAYEVDDFDLFGLKLDFEATESATAAGLLGMDVLGALVFVLDGPNHTLWLHHRR